MLPVYFIRNKYYFIYYKIIEQSKSRNISGYVEKHHIIPKSLGGTNNKSNIAHLTAKEHFICHRLLTKFTTGKNQLAMSRAAWRITHSNINHQRLKISSSLYEKLKIKSAEDHSKLMKNIPKTTEHIANMKNAFKGRKSSFKGKTHSDKVKIESSIRIKKNKTNGDGVYSKEAREKRIASRKGYTHSEETKRKISESQKGKTVIVSDQTKSKISETLKERHQDHHLKGKVAHNRGKSRTDEEKAKMSASHQNREQITCEHCNKKVPKPNYSRWHGINCRAV